MALRRPIVRMERGTPTPVERVVIETIPHEKQRYRTIGDWLYDPMTGTITIYTSDLGDWRMNMSCAVHELVETLLCIDTRVNEEAVSAFDIAYENARAAGISAPCGCRPTEDSEPGEDAHAPYRRQHAFADALERLLALQLGVVWDEYGQRALDLPGPL